MPVVATAPYDTLGTILQQAIVRSGDQAGPAGIVGNILNSNQPGVIQLANGCYRDMQDELVSHGVETYNKYGYIFGIPPANTSNPSSQIYINYVGYFDGQEMLADWYLPPDMLKVLEVWERQTGNNYWNRLTAAADSLSTRPMMPRFNSWDWETETLYLPPNTQTTDLKFKYICYAPDLTTISSPVLVARCQTALAYRILSEVAKQRGGLEMAAVWKQDYQTYRDAIVNRTARSESYKAFFRKPFRNRRSARGRG